MIRVHCLRLAGILALGAGLATAAAAQDMTINLNPQMITSLPCEALMAGISAVGDDLGETTKRAAEGGYRFGYVMGYVHGTLDAGGTKAPLSSEELETFFGTYNLMCENNRKLSIYDAAREAMGYQSR